MPVSSPYALFRAADLAWFAPTPAAPQARLATGTTLIQGELFQPNGLSCLSGVACSSASKSSP
jgi:hypothetical protein